MPSLDMYAAKDLVEKSETEFLTPNSEKILLELIELRKRIDDAIETARKSAENILKTLEVAK